MKLLSSSSSSSASSTASFDANVCNSKRATAGCIVGVIRRFLCSTSLPTYPSDHITENNSVLCENVQGLKDKQRVEPPPTPGLMARLMGLETMPATNSAHSQMTPNSITRSRSMNSADYLQECDEMQVKHRRVKTSLSFRELPTFLELENEEFFVLSFENASKTKELGSKGKKTEMGCGELKQKRAERRKNKENRTENVPEKRKNEEDQQTRKKVSIEKENLIIRVSDNTSQLIGDNFDVKDSTNILRPTTKNSTAEPCTPSDVVKPLKPTTDHKEVCDAAKLRKKIKKHSVDKKVVLESCSEDWSPVSVFEFEEFLFDLEVPISDEDSRRKDSNSRRKLSPELEKYRHSSVHNTETSIADDREPPKKGEAIDLESRKKDAQNINCVSSMWCEICRLARGDIMGSNWRCRGDMGNLEEFEEISAGFEVQILDQLLNELVDQLVEPLMQKH